MRTNTLKGMQKNIFIGVCCIVLFSNFSLLTAQSATDKQIIHFWQFWSKEWVQPAIDAFEQQNPNVEVVLERLTWANGQNKIITAMAANQAPDVIEIGSTWVAGFSGDGGLQPMEVGDLTEKISNWESAYYDGKYYAVPWTLSANALFYNQDLLAAANIKQPPKTWDDLLTQSSAIHNEANGIYGYGVKTGAYTTWQKFLPFAWSNGGRLISEDWKNSTVDQPAFVEAVDFYFKLRQVGFYDENTAVRQAFQEGRLGFMLDDPGQIKKFNTETPDLKFGVVLLPVAPRTKQSVIFSGSQMLAITKNSNHPKTAEKFIRFMVQAENAKLITTRITTLFPADKSGTQDDFYQKEHPELLVFLESLKNASSPPAHPRWVEIQEVLSEQLERVMYGQLSPQEAMQQAKQRIEIVLSETF